MDTKTANQVSDSDSDFETEILKNQAYQKKSQTLNKLVINTSMHVFLSMKTSEKKLRKNGKKCKSKRW